jgi:hypothetical protein
VCICGISEVGILLGPCAEGDVLASGCVRVTRVTGVPSKEEAATTMICALSGSTTRVVDKGSETPNPYGKPNVGGFMPKYWLVVELAGK